MSQAGESTKVTLPSLLLNRVLIYGTGLAIHHDLCQKGLRPFSISISLEFHPPVCLIKSQEN